MPAALGRGVRVKGGWVYVMANRRGGALYVGVTADLVRRVGEHKAGTTGGFTARYGVTRLVYFERHEEIVAAIAREKTVKRWPRVWKIQLIERDNPNWKDLWAGIL